MATSFPESEIPLLPTGRWMLTFWCLLAAFGSYFCMYGFRKPFTVAEYAEISFWGIGFKTILVTMQVLGYTLSKFLGIKIIAEMPLIGGRLVFYC